MCPSNLPCKSRWSGRSAGFAWLQSMKGTESSTPPDMAGQTLFPSHLPIWLDASAAGSACLCCQKPASLLAAGLPMSWPVLCWHLPSLLTCSGWPYVPRQPDLCLSLSVSGTWAQGRSLKIHVKMSLVHTVQVACGASVHSPCLPPRDALENAHVCVCVCAE